MRNYIFWLLVIPVLLLTVPLQGYRSLSYYAQAVRGHWAILNSRRPIREVIEDPHTPLYIKEKLRRILDIREFAKKELHLPVGNNYLSYADIARPYAVWNVFAAPEFSLIPKRWCFPVAGCTPYRGYFSKEDAERFTSQLREKGYDVYVGGAAAYSTLGWFDDPVLSTLMRRGDAKLAGLIFHELAHRKLYVKDDTTFNESFAVAVQQEGVRLWLSAAGNRDAYKAYEYDYRRHRRFVRLIMGTRESLEKLYKKEGSSQEKREEKELIITRLRERYKEFKKEWDGYAGYDRWISHPLNNAQLNTISVYHDLVPAFIRILHSVNGDFDLFYEKCEALSRESGGARHDRLLKFEVI